MAPEVWFHSVHIEAQKLTKGKQEKEENKIKSKTAPGIVSNSKTGIERLNLAHPSTICFLGLLPPTIGVLGFWVAPSFSEGGECVSAQLGEHLLTKLSPVLPSRWASAAGSV